MQLLDIILDGIVDDTVGSVRDVVVVTTATDRRSFEEGDVAEDVLPRGVRRIIRTSRLTLLCNTKGILYALRGSDDLSLTCRPQVLTDGDGYTQTLRAFALALLEL